MDGWDIGQFGVELRRWEAGEEGDSMEGNQTGLGYLLVCV